MRTANTNTRKALMAAMLSLTLMHAFGGLSEAHLCIIREGDESAGAPETDDRFGTAVAAGDFDGDGFEDLATGANGENEDIFGSAEHGVVVVNYGSQYGLTHEDADYVSIGVPADNLVHFGSAIACGDFNNDGRDDLAIGAPDLDLDLMADAGAVGIVYGHAWGVGTNPELILDETDVPGGLLETSDHFGCAVAVADFNSDGYDDLAVGSYGENSAAGAIFFFRGGPGGLSGVGSGAMTQASLGYSSVANDNFGWSLAAGDVAGTSYPDLIVGTPRKTVSGHSQAGQVYIIRGSAAGLTAASASMLNLGTLGLSFTTADQFGSSLAVGHFYETTGPLDLVIGSPRYDATGTTDAGRIIVVDSGAPSGPTPLVFDQGDLGSAAPESNDQFGYALAAGDWDNDGYDDIAIGTPYEDVDGTSDAGYAQILMGGAGGPDGGGSVDLSTKTLNDTPGTLDYLGRAVAFGHFDDSQRANLAVGAPGKDFASVYPPGASAIDKAGSVFIAAPWRQVQGLDSWSSIAVDCEGSIIFSQKMFDPVRMASTTKAMTLLLASEWSNPAHPGYHAAYTNLNTVYTVPSWVANNIPGSQADLATLQKITLLGLMRAMMPVSGNDAAYAIADHTTGGGHPWVGLVGTVQAFVDSMNVRAAQLGMYDTHFVTPKGSNEDDPGFPGTPGTQGAHTTAYDFALLSRAVMENPLARSIVGTEGWSVTSMKWFAIPGIYIPVNDYFANGFFQGVEDQLGDLAAGVKGGSTPEALKTGLFAAAEDSTADAAIVTMFRVPPDSAQTAPACTLLGLALDECLDDVSFAPTPVPPWHPTHFVVPDIPTCVDTCWGGSFGLTAEDPDTTDIELLVKALDSGPASATIRTQPLWNVRLSGGGTHAVSFGPLDSHQGFVVRNTGPTPATLVISHTGSPSPTTVVINGYTEQAFPSYSTSGPSDYWIRVQNVGSGDADTEIEVHDWTRTVSLPTVGRGIPGGPLHFGQLLVNGEETVRSVAVMVQGRDRACGNVLTLTAQDHGVAVTDVEPPMGDGPLGDATPDSGVQLTIAGTPNPFSAAGGGTSIRYALGTAAGVSLEIFDVEGRLVRRLMDRRSAFAGTYEVAWDGRNDSGRPLAPGVYFARLGADQREARARLILMK